MSPMGSAFKTVTSLFRSPAKEVGLPPGSLVYVGDQRGERPVFSCIEYNSESLSQRADVSFEDCTTLKNARNISWINLDGVHDTQLVDRVGKTFALHALMLEDILNTNHPPKFEEFADSALIIMKMIYYNTQHELSSEQISLVLTGNNILTFQETTGDVFDSVRERLQRKSGRIRERGADYLAYALLDCVVDSYFHVLERLGDRLDQMETELIAHPTQELLQQIHQFKGQLVYFRKSVWPLRELVGSMMHSESPLFATTTGAFLRDLYDHVLQVLDTVETFRDTASGLVDLYMSSVSQHMNEVMQVLTIMASIFIPLTFIAGIYGMNFEFMPELKWRYGYPLVGGGMLLCVVVMLWFFKRKKWF